MGLAGVVPIVLNCYVGHQSVHGIMAMLKPYSVSDMKVGGALLGHCCYTDTYTRLPQLRLPAAHCLLELLSFVICRAS
jgi:hypothetical protein